jgi:glycerophosphoryl diester phosphodiesterase
MAPSPHITAIAAHRGGAALEPENSLRAFEQAIQLGADQIETDVHLSSDGQPVLIHDPTLDRTTLATGIVRAYSWEKLREVELRNKGGCVPHLSDLLVMLRASSTSLRLEIKVDSHRQRYPGISEVVLHHLKRYDMLSRCRFSSFDWASLEELGRLLPQSGRIGLIKRPRFTELGGLNSVCAHAKSYGIQEVAVHDEQYATGMVAQAQLLGMRLGLYAVNTQSSIERALKDAVCAFTTDHPDLALSIRARLSS